MTRQSILRDWGRTKWPSASLPYYQMQTGKPPPVMTLSSYVDEVVLPAAANLANHNAAGELESDMLNAPPRYIFDNRKGPGFTGLSMDRMFPQVPQSLADGLSGSASFKTDISQVS